MILNGKELADKILEKIKSEDNGTYKKLAIVTFDNDSASKVYVRNKIRSCERAGVPCEKVLLTEGYMDTYIEKIIELNEDENVGGIIIQLPLPKGIDDKELSKYISDDKDVDGFKLTSKYKPCTPSGIITLIEEYKGKSWFSGKNAVVIGRSAIVGRPMSYMLLDKDMTVSIAHSRTPREKLETLLKDADLVVAAVGIPHFIDESLLKHGATVIDVGINKLDDGTLAGDCNMKSDEIYDYTPVPGGVGPMTVVTLIRRVASKK